MAMTEAPLVLLPGMNCSAALWAGLDLGGRPADRTPVLTPRLTEPTLAAQIGRLLDELPDRFVLAGLSLGGIVAMALARTDPQRVAALVLLNTNPYAPTPEQIAGWRSSRDALAAGRSARELQSDWLSLLLSPAAQARPELVATTLEMADETGEAELDAQLALQATRVDERPGLSRLRCPVRVVAGELDRLCGVERHREIAALVPGAELVVLPCGHLSPLEMPEAVASHLLIR